MPHVLTTLNNQNFNNRNFNNLKENQSYNINIEDSIHLNRLSSKMNDQLKINSSILSKDQNRSIKNSAINSSNISYTDQNQNSFTNKLNFQSSHLNPNQSLNDSKINFLSQSSISKKSSHMDLFASHNYSQGNKPDTLLPFKLKKGGKKTKKTANKYSKISSQSSNFNKESDETFFEDCEEDLLNNLNSSNKNLPDIYRDKNNINPNDIPNHKDDVNIFNFDGISVDKIANLVFNSGLQYTQAYSQSYLRDIIFEGLIPANNACAFKFQFCDYEKKKSHVMFYTRDQVCMVESLRMGERCRVNSIRIYQIICQTSGFVGIYMLLGN